MEVRFLGKKLSDKEIATTLEEIRGQFPDFDIKREEEKKLFPGFAEGVVIGVSSAVAWEGLKTLVRGLVQKRKLVLDPKSVQPFVEAYLTFEVGCERFSLRERRDGDDWSLFLYESKGAAIHRLKVYYDTCRIEYKREVP